jgi:hypothetical protein
MQNSTNQALEFGMYSDFFLSTFNEMTHSSPACLRKKCSWELEHNLREITSKKPQSLWFQESWGRFGMESKKIQNQEEGT